MKARSRFVGYGGAKGGGKSHAIRAKASYLAFKYPGIQMLIVRRTFPELYENHTKRLRAAYAALPENLQPRYNESEKAFTFPWGSRLKLGYCSDEGDVLQYQGQEYDVLFIDEATQLTEYQFTWLCACVRGANKIPKRIYLTCNPGGVGHAWVKRLFIDKDYRRGEDKRDYVFIQAHVFDNPRLFDADEGYKRSLAAHRKKHGKTLPRCELERRAMRDSAYVRQLESLSPQLRRAWLDGDWNVFAGQYFSEFSEDAHVCEPFALPAHWRKSAALDYGLDMLAVLWFAVDENGFAYCYRSIEIPNLTISEAANALLKVQSEQVEEVVAPPDLWNRRQDSGRSAADIFAENGVPLVRAGNSRVDGWLCVKEYLRIFGGVPRMRFFSTCAPVLRCLPLLRHDKLRTGDAATEPHDLTHSPDALRYWCGRRQIQPLAVRTPASDPFSRYGKDKGNAIDNYLLGGFEP